jgi:putative membrane protein
MTREKTIKEAFLSSPGPDSAFAYLKLFTKGLAMGTADIVPGVSGGTVAFITGIYERLINAIKSIDGVFLKHLLRFQFIEALSHVHFRFLLTLFLGIVAALVSLAKIMSYLIAVYPEYTWSLFFGLILASVFLIGAKITNIYGSGGLWLIFGFSLAFFTIGLIPLSTPNAWWFIFLSGAIAICAMILPGISGAFILLLLGKYEYMVFALKNPFVGENQIIIIIFILGCLTGIILFSRVLSFIFKNYHNVAIAILTGMVIGSLRKIWPWKNVVEERLADGSVFRTLEQNILPGIQMSTIYQIVIIILGFTAVIYIEKKTGKKTA